LFEPSGYAVKVERMITGAPGCSALVSSISDLVGLAVDASLHDVVLANGAVVDVDV
jgi:hypothetical protein